MKNKPFCGGFGVRWNGFFGMMEMMNDLSSSILVEWAGVKRGSSRHESKEFRICNQRREA